jgi:hypothetical protein
MTMILAASAALAAARAAWEDPFREGGSEGLAELITGAPGGTRVEGEYMPSLTVAQRGTGWSRLTGDGVAAEPGQWCSCDPPASQWMYYETWETDRGRVAHGWVDRDCRRLVQSG